MDKQNQEIKQKPNENRVLVEYQPECNTKHLRTFLKSMDFHGLFMLSAFLIFSFIFFICIFICSSHIFNTGAWYFPLSVAACAIGSLAGAGLYATTDKNFQLLILPLTVFLGYRLAKILLQPTHLIFDENGIYLMWNQRLGQPKRQIVKWSNLSYIDVTQLSYKAKKAERIIVFKSKDLDAKDGKVKLSAFTDSEGRPKLLTAIRTWATNIPRNSQLGELLEPSTASGYTELWLNALTATQGRTLLTPLEPSATLKNGTYRIDHKIAIGGQGTAYAATCLESNSDGLKANSKVVLKEYILPAQVSINARKQSIDTLQNETSILATLSHPNVVKLLDHFVQDHRGYLVLEHIDGSNLLDLVKQRGPLPEDEVRSLALQMCFILEYLHSQSPPVVHRDFTPDNLILTKDGVLKLIDFNVARQSISTVTATVVGKHCYLPPEQFKGKPEPRSDIYAMGCTLFYLLTGTEPEPLSISSPAKLKDDLSPELNQLVERATQLDSKQRYSTIEELRQELNSSEDPKPIGSELNGALLSFIQEPM